MRTTFTNKSRVTRCHNFRVVLRVFFLIKPGNGGTNADDGMAREKSKKLICSANRLTHFRPMFHLQTNKVVGFY